MIGMKKIIWTTLLYSIIAGVVFGQGYFMLDDQFNDNRNMWYEGTTANYLFQVQNGSYIFDNFSTQTWAVNKNIGLFPNENFTVEASLRHVYGINNNIYGVAWGFIDPNNYYAFGISDNGQFLYGKWVNGAFVALRLWTQSPYINKNNSINTLKVQHINNVINLFINGNLVSTENYEPSPALNVGFVAAGPQRIEVDFVRADRNPF